jgi:hypothetical protein
VVLEAAVEWRQLTSPLQGKKGTNVGIIYFFGEVDVSSACGG